MLLTNIKIRYILRTDRHEGVIFEATICRTASHRQKDNRTEKMENPTPGKFLVHASKYKPTDEELDQFKLKREDLDFGAIIGSAVLIDIKDYGNCVESEWARDCDKHLAGAEYIESQIGFLLKDAVKFDEPRPFKGQLNFFETDYKQEKLC